MTTQNEKLVERIERIKDEFALLENEELRSGDTLDFSDVFTQLDLLKADIAALSPPAAPVEDMENHVALAAEQSREGRSSLTLLPCPFCGSHRVFVDRIRDGLEVACGCGGVGPAAYHGPNKDTGARAAAAWNKRAAPSTFVELDAAADAAWKALAWIINYDSEDGTLRHAMGRIERARKLAGTFDYDAMRAAVEERCPADSTREVQRGSPTASPPTPNAGGTREAAIERAKQHSHYRLAPPNAGGLDPATLEAAAKVVETTQVPGNGHPQIDAPTIGDAMRVWAAAIRALGGNGEKQDSRP